MEGHVKILPLIPTLFVSQPSAHIRKVVQPAKVLAAIALHKKIARFALSSYTSAIHILLHLRVYVETDACACIYAQLCVHNAACKN